MNTKMKMKIFFKQENFKTKWLFIVPIFLFIATNLFSVNALADDTTAPTGYINVSSFYGEVAGNTVQISVSTEDNESLVKDVCLWLGDETNNLIQPAMCKTLAERDWNSYDYAPSFAFSWDSTTIADGTYNLYVIATDNANNVGKLGPVAMTINNYSLGSPSLPAPITNCQEFQNIKDHGGWYYEIKNDINCAETNTWNSGKGFLPITFGGVLNGNNYHIRYLYMNTLYPGIFGQIDGGSRISGVNFRKVELICHSTYCGGFSSYNWGTIEKSSITGSLQPSGSGHTGGGFAIQNSGTISQSWGDMTIGNGGYVGGFVGHSVDGVIENSYFKGEIQSIGAGGGLVGLNEGWFRNGIINNSYSTAKISGGSSNGGMIGWQYQRGTQSGSYWNTEKSGLAIMCGSDALGGSNCDDTHGLTDAQMKLQASFVGWDFDNIWKIDPDKNDGYPYLAWQTFQVDTTAPTVAMTSLASDPTNASPIAVSVTFSESVTGFTSTDIVPTNGAVSNFAGSGASYTFDLTPAGQGVVTADIAAGVATDSTGNGNTIAAQFSRAYDTTASTVLSNLRANPSPTNLASVNFIVTFSESVTGVDTADFVITTTGVTGAAVTGVTGSGATRTVNVNTGTMNGTLRLDMPSSATITDLAGNPLAGLPYTGGETYTVEKICLIYLPLIVR